MSEANFLRQAAEYFRNCDTGGEDMAHWANVFNAENCEKAAAELTRLTARVAELEASLDNERAAHQVACDQRNAAERERDAARAELNETWTDENGTVWTRPTAWAYAHACKNRNARAESAERERDEALMLCEGPSTLKEMAAMCFERGLRTDAAERERDEARRECGRLRAAAQHCVNVLAEYERKPGYDLRGFMLGALDNARAALTDQATSQPKEPT